MSTEFKNYEEMEDALIESTSFPKLSESQKGSMRQMLRNSHSQNANRANRDGNATLVEAEGPTGGTSTGNITRYDTLFLPLQRRVVPQLLAFDLVGTQPLNMPTGLVRTIRTRYGETTLDTAGGSPVVTAGEEASGQNVYEKYSSLALGDNYDAVDNLDPYEQTQHLEWDRGKPMTVDVVQDRVETGIRKLHTSWSIEAEQDFSAIDGIDLESELSAAAGDELRREMDRELINKLTGLAGTVRSFDFTNVDGRYAGERLAAMAIQIDSLNADIAQATRLGGATWMVVSNRVFTGLKHASNGLFTPATDTLVSSSSLYVGMMGSVRVYVDPYLETDQVLMGHKGSEVQTGLIYCPFAPLFSTGTMQNTDDGSYRTILGSRYGYYAATDPAVSLATAKDFYARLSIANINLGLK